MSCQGFFRGSLHPKYLNHRTIRTSYVSRRRISNRALRIPPPNRRIPRCPGGETTKRRVSGLPVLRSRNHGRKMKWNPYVPYKWYLPKKTCFMENWRVEVLFAKGSLLSTICNYFLIVGSAIWCHIWLTIVERYFSVWCGYNVYNDMLPRHPKFVGVKNWVVVWNVFLLSCRKLRRWPNLTSTICSNGLVQTPTRKYSSIWELWTCFVSNVPGTCQTSFINQKWNCTVSNIFFVTKCKQKSCESITMVSQPTSTQRYPSPEIAGLFESWLAIRFPWGRHNINALQ